MQELLVICFLSGRNGGSVVGESVLSQSSNRRASVLSLEKGPCWQGIQMQKTYKYHSEGLCKLQKAVWEKILWDTVQKFLRRKSMGLCVWARISKFKRQDRKLVRKQLCWRWFGIRTDYTMKTNRMKSKTGVGKQEA